MRSLNFDGKKPLIYLVATPIGNLDEMSPRAIEILSNADLIACEDTRNTAKLLNLFNISKPLVSIREHNETSESEKIVNQILQGKVVTYVSDAGYPCISDPGARLVKICLKNNINVSTISGPNAALNALAASGLPTDHFYFHGFLNAKSTIRKQELGDLKNRTETLIFYESPHRIEKTLKEMFEILENRHVCIARELTKKHEEFIRDELKNIINIDPETLKGEMVIIVEGCQTKLNETIDDNKLIEMINNEIRLGLTPKDAIKKISEITKINKNYIYKIFHSD